MKVRRILLDEHAERLRRGTCPRCNKFSLVNIQVNKGQQLPRSKYKICNSYWECSGPDKFLCFFMSDLSGSVVFESSDGVSLIDFTVENEKNNYARLVRRRAGNCVDLTPRSSSYQTCA